MRAKSSVWWPRIYSQIQRLVSACEKYQIDKPSLRKEPLKTTPLPERPWSKVGIDFAEYQGHKYLVMVCYYSRFIEILHMSSTNSSSVISRLKGVFARFGIPDVLVSDNGPPFGSVDFRDFTQVYGIKHTTSSPHFPQANGEVERAVQVAKRILSQRDPPLALMNYLSTPHSATGYTPSQLLFGREIRTRVPVLPCVLKPGWPSYSEVKTNDGAAKDAYAFYYNRRYGARELPALQSGDRVRMKVDSDFREEVE